MVFRSVRLLMVGVVTLFCLAAEATNPAVGNDSFAHYRQQLEAELGPGKRYGEIRSADRQRVQQLLTGMQAQLGGNDHPTALDVAAQARFAADQHELDGLLATAVQDSSKVCERRAGTGTRFGRKVCTTATQRRQQREVAREALRDPLRPAGRVEP